MRSTELLVDKEEPEFKVDEAQWQKDHWKAMNALSGVRKNKHASIVLSGQKIIADTWTTSRRSTSPTAQPGTSGTGTKTPSCWYAVMMIGKLDRCEGEKIFQVHHANSRGNSQNLRTSRMHQLVGGWAHNACCVWLSLSRCHVCLPWPKCSAESTRFSHRPTLR